MDFGFCSAQNRIFGGRYRSLWVTLAFILIFAFAFSSCSGSGERISDIRSIRYDKEDGRIMVSATLDSSDVREFRGETVYLIEIPANSDISEITTLIPVSQARAGAEMQFSLPLREGARTMLYSSFVLAVFDREKGYIPLCDAKCIENPSSLAQNTASYPEYSSIKGLSIVSSSEAVAMGTKHTVIRIGIEDYLLSGAQDGAVSYIFDGASYYYNSDRLAELDYKVKTLSEAGIEVIFEFSLGASSEALPSALSLLASKQTPMSEWEEDADNYVISVDSGAGYRYMAAFFEMLAERYTRSDGKYGFAGAYIIGNGANSALDDGRTLSERASSYGKLLRIAASALRSKYASGKVFASVDNKWNLQDEGDLSEEKTENTENAAAPVAQRTAFGGAEFLTALKKNLESLGFSDYGIALIPNSHEDDSDITDDALAKEAKDTEFVTFKNLSVVRSHIGEDTELILYRVEISSEDEEAMARSYAYAYGMALENGVSAFIYNGQWDRATGNGDSGLWKTDGAGVAYEKRQICHVYADIDRVGATRAYYPEKLKDAESLYVTTGGGSTFIDEKNKALNKAEKVSLFDFSDGKSHDFFPSDSAKYVEISNFIGANALKSALQPKYDGENVGVRSAPIPYEDLKKALAISAVISADPGEGNTALVTLALAQNGVEKSVFHTSSVSIQASNRQTVYFDISDAELDSDLGDITLYLWVRNEGARSLLYDNPEAIEEKEQLLYIESMTAHIKKGSGVLVAVIIIIVVLLLLAIAYFIFFTPKVNTRPPQGHNARRVGRPPLPQGAKNGRRPMQQRSPRPPQAGPRGQRGQIPPRPSSQRPMPKGMNRPTSGENRWNQNTR